VPVAVPLVAAGAAVAGSVISSNASRNAARTAQNVANQNNQLQADIYARNTAALDPYVQAGNTATPAIQALLGLQGTGAGAQANQNAAFNNFRNSAGYQDQFNEGARAVTSALGNRGLLDSGAAQRALTRYGQAQSNQSFGDYYNRLERQQQIGLAGASAIAGVGTNYANTVSQNNIYAGETAANASLTNAANINSLLQSGVGAYAFSQGLGSSYGNRQNTAALGGGIYSGLAALRGF
jgi:hypothetical protein